MTTKKSKVTRVSTKESSSMKKSETIVSKITNPKLLSALFFEFIGTFILATVVLATKGAPLYVWIALVGIVLFAGKISGAHVNPLITAGAWVTRRIPSINAILYVVAQTLGAMIAFVLVKAYVDQANAGSNMAESNPLQMQQQVEMFTAGTLKSGIEWLVMAAELIGSFIFAFIVATVTSDKEKNDTAVAIGVGSGLAIAILIAGSFAGVINASTILNPAVAVALQAFTLEGQNVAFAVAIYAGTALLGGALGFLASSLFAKISK